MANGLPSYKNPPLVEVVFGLQFERLASFQAVHFGEFWSRIKSELPIAETAPPLPPMIEPFGDDRRSQKVTFELGNTPDLPRAWYQSEDRSALCQLQADRLHFNWRRSGEGNIYPRFEAVFEQFKAFEKHLREFVTSNGLGSVTPTQYELTYINIIEWDPESPISSILPDVGWRSQKDRHLSEPETFDLRSTFRLPDGKSRAHMRAGTAFDPEQLDEVIRLELTVRGSDPDHGNDLDAWFGMAHEWIVRSFADVTHVSLQEDTWQKES